MLKKFSQLLAQKREEAKLSISELASLTGMPESKLEALEKGSGDLPDFDTCYRLGQVISSHSGKMFVLQDLWQALRADKLEMNPTSAIYLAS